MSRNIVRDTPFLTFATCSAFLVLASPAGAHIGADAMLAPVSATGMTLGGSVADALGSTVQSQPLYQEARRGRGRDDGPGHVRHGRGRDDGPGHDRRGRSSDDGPNHT